ncbi:hemagglutinin repeat-containing protein, partial [Pseudomonas mosselii]|uniref:hemagglutinin repeat-containing protein n=1 Tax=Pseudomonas mosselii TaxID=78327 RepID=UPI002452132A|nr:hemagglutinin repeat-containing protein [Pseudomonas mosselii]
VQGVPERSVPNVSHKYLVETNPVLTDLKQFLSSDYMLGQLNIKPDQAIKRLGDGLYEQRLIREAVVARTGQRYIDGMTSDETLFRYLMDNAIASKDKLSLSVGVSLSAEQVAALTHDIVWMEQVEVNGEKVLAPVLYLAHANGRVAPNGALIQGRDVNLISGGELVNVGTLRATNNLAVSATNIGNAGLMEAGGRLDMLATESIRNAQGGIIAGREVSLTALTGDVINERSVTRLEGRAGGEHVTKDLVDTAARIEAANNLTITAGQDIGIVGGAVQAGGNIDMDAGRDLIIASQEGVDSHEYQRRRVSGHDTSITQYGSEVKAGGNLTATAGQDLSIVASEIEARRDLALQAGRDVTLAAAANEEHSYAKGKKGKTKYERQEDDVEQQSAEVKAGGDLTIDAGRDLRMVASKASAGDEAYLVAGDKLELLAANDSQYSLYDMNKKGGWGSKKTQRDEVTDVKAVGSEITSGGGTSLVSGGDQLYQGAKIEAGGDLAIISGGAVTFEAVKDMHQESHEKSKGDLAWNSAKGKGTTDETLRQNQLVAQGVMTIKAVDGLKIDIKHIDQATVSQSIDAMVKADPKLAWLKEAELRGDVDWRRVKEVHDSFKYDQSGLGTGASLVIAIIVTYLTWGAGASLVGAAGNSTIGFAANSVVSAAATNAATSTINNRGNLGAVVKDVTSSDAMKGYVMSALTPGGGSIVSRIALKAALSTVVYGGSLKDNAVQAGLEIAADALSGAIFNEVGDRLMGSGLPKRVAVHAIVGGLIAEAAGGDFRTAALAAGANEALVQLVGDKIFPGEAHDRVLGMTSQLVGMTVAAGLGADAKDQQIAGWVAQQATENNFLRHKEVEAFLAELKTCEANNSCAEVRKRYGELNAENQERLQSLCARDMAACHDEYKLFSDDYQKTHKLLAESMKDVGWRDKYNLGATILSNYQAMQTLVGTAMTKAMTDAAMEAAGQAGVEVDAEDVGIFGMWLRTVVKAVTNRKGAVGAKATGAAGDSTGAMRRLDYETAPYHGKVDNAVKSRAPINGQDALDTSIQVKATSPRRVGIDYDSKEFVVFDKTLDTTYHGHVRSWKDLHPDMQKALQQAGMADRKGNILFGGKQL